MDTTHSKEMNTETAAGYNRETDGLTDWLLDRNQKRALLLVQ